MSGIALTWQHTSYEQARHHLEIYQEVLETGRKLSSQAFVAAPKACTSLHDIGSAKQVHAQVLRHELQSDVHLGTVLVHECAKCGSLVDARTVFELINFRKCGCVESHDPELCKDARRG